MASAALVNLGCRVNRVESDLIAESLEEAGVRLVAPEDADVVVINTCAVTGEAEAKTRKTIRHMAALPQAPSVVATGCVASLFASELEGLASNVLVEADKSRVAGRVLAELGINAGATDDAGELVLAPTPTGRTRPGIKVQDGCDNRCTYCIVWKARGKGRSVAPEEARAAVMRSVSHGAREVVLTGINLGRYEAEGPDGGVMRLPGLIRYLCETTPVGRIRLSSIEPPDVDGELLSVMAEEGERVAPFLHICLQSGCDETLRRMGRVYDTAFYRDAVVRARKALPDLALGCDLIVGFPGETDEEFEQSFEFCREMRYAKMHIFRYSKRPGTWAATAPGQVDPHVMAERSRRMRALADEMRAEEAARRVGKDELVIVQAPGRAVTGGLFDCLVDEDIACDTLAHVRVAAADSRGVLDARSARLAADEAAGPAGSAVQAGPGTRASRI